MTRFVNPVPQFFDAAGNPLSVGALYFYDSVNTTTEKDTYSDSDNSTPNTNPVILDGEGRLNNCFLSGVYNVELWSAPKLETGAYQVWQRNPVSSADDLLGDWASGSTYNENQIAIGSDTFFYISLTDKNKGNDPTIDDGSNWTRVQFLGDWAKGKQYPANAWAIGSDGTIYISKISNINIDPTLGDTDTWYKYGGGPVLQPTNVSPADEAISVPVFPTLTGDAFQIANGTDDHILSNWQVATDEDFTSIAYDSAFDKDRTEHTTDSTLLSATEYWFRVKYVGARTASSEYSEPTSFTTQVGASNQFAIDLWTGTGSPMDITNSINFDVSEGMIWIKSLSNVADHNLVDTTSGNQKYLSSNSTSPESTDLNKVTAFNSNGFSIGANPELNVLNEDYAAYTFIERSGFFDVVKYVGDGTASQIINHNLNSSVGLVLVKSNTDSQGWDGGSSAFFVAGNPIYSLDSDIAFTGSSGVDGSPSSSAFTVDGLLNTLNSQYTAYLFADNEQQGVTAGKYVGTGAALDITTNFQTCFVMIKNVDEVADWVIFDCVRDTVNPAKLVIKPNNTEAETTQASGIDFKTDGFTLLGNEIETNTLGDNYIYLAIADPSTI